MFLKWTQIYQLLKKIKIDRLITLKRIVLGYKPFDKDCFYFNYLLIIIGISIYKSYCVSEQKTKHINA